MWRNAEGWRQDADGWWFKTEVAARVIEHKTEQTFDIVTPRATEPKTECEEVTASVTEAKAECEEVTARVIEPKTEGEEVTEGCEEVAGGRGERVAERTGAEPGPRKRRWGPSANKIHTCSDGYGLVGV